MVSSCCLMLLSWRRCDSSSCCRNAAMVSSWCWSRWRALWRMSHRPQAMRLHCASPTLSAMISPQRRPGFARCSNASTARRRSSSFIGLSSTTTTDCISSNPVSVVKQEPTPAPVSSTGQALRAYKEGTCQHQPVQSKTCSLFPSREGMGVWTPSLGVRASSPQEIKQAGKMPALPGGRKERRCHWW